MHSTCSTANVNKRKVVPKCKFERFWLERKDQSEELPPYTWKAALTFTVFLVFQEP